MFPSARQGVRNTFSPHFCVSRCFRLSLSFFLFYAGSAEVPFTLSQDACPAIGIVVFFFNTFFFFFKSFPFTSASRTIFFFLGDAYLWRTCSNPGSILVFFFSFQLSDFVVLPSCSRSPDSTFALALGTPRLIFFPGSNKLSALICHMRIWVLFYQTSGCVMLRPPVEAPLCSEGF